MRYYGYSKQIPVFYIHTYVHYPNTVPAAPWGWLSRDRDPDAPKIALWYYAPPVPGNHPDARDEWYVGRPLFPGEKLYTGWRIVNARGHTIVDRIDSAPAARDVQTWLSTTPRTAP